MSMENVDVSAPTTSETKVFYYLEDNADPTPYFMMVPASPDVITLKDCKEHFTRISAKCGQNEYRWYCKAFDPDIGTDVKMELTNDERRRLSRNAKGLFELHLVTVGYGTLSRAGTLPRRVVNDVERKARRRSAEFDNYGPSFPVSLPASSRGTVVSRRAGEHLAELYTSTSEDHYRFDESSKISGLSSSAYEPLPINHRQEQIRRRKPRKERYRKAYVPSTIGSQSESSMSQDLERIVEVEVSFRNAMHLGISVASIDGNIFISDITPDGAVANNRMIEVGDQILQVNNQSFQQLNERDAVNLLKRVAQAKKNVKMFIAKPQRTGGMDPLAELASETLPLDISLWVQSAAQCSARDRVTGGGNDTTQQTFDDGTLGPGETDDEEEQRLYDQRRNGIPRHILEEQERRRENEQNEQQLPERLSTRLHPQMIVRAMARQNSGLQIKNRKWLKIAVPNSVIGSDLVKWLQENVDELGDRKTARNYAARLLEIGLIGHVVNKASFTEKCYYVFGEPIVGPRSGADSSGNSGGTLRAEATTEVTYVGSPAPGGIRQIRNPLQSVPFPLADQTWPISPITVFDKTTRGLRRRDCESTITDDYASMVGVDSTMSYTVGIQNGYVRRCPPPNTPLSAGGSTLMSQIAPPHPSPCETEFEDDDKRRILTNK